MGVAVVSVVTLHQSSPSVSNGSDSLMSTTMAVATEGHSGYSNIDNDQSTLSEKEKQMTVIDTSLDAKDDSASIVNQCGNTHNLNFKYPFPYVVVRTHGCAFMNRNGEITGTVFLIVGGVPQQSITIRNGNTPSVQAISLVKGGTLVVSYATASQIDGGTVKIQINWSNRDCSENASETRSTSGLPPP